MSLSLIACGDASSENGNSDDGGIVTSRIMNESSNHSISDFETAGLKKPKAIKADAVDKKTGERITPEATEVHVGFFKSSLGPKDIEVRFYANHDDAVKMGQEPAESITEKPSNLVGNSSVTTLADAGVGMKGSTKYGGYAISGNVVILCERELQACLDFIDLLP